MEQLSKKIGYWDNAQNNSEIQQRNNTIGEIKRCLNMDSNLLRIKNQGNLEYSVRGSISKGNDTTLSSDLDLHVIFSNNYELSDCKDYVYKILRNHFGSSNVIKNRITFSLLANINRIKADILVGVREDDKKINALNSSGEVVPFYPDIDESNVARINSEYRNNYSKLVRTYKGLKHEMENNNYLSCNKVPSFIIECLLYNCKESLYDIDNYESEVGNESKYRKMFMDLKACIFSAQLASYDLGKEYLEINGRKVLFRSETIWNNIRTFLEDINAYLKENYKVNE